MTWRNGQLNAYTLTNALTNSQSGTNNQAKCKICMNDIMCLSSWWLIPCSFWQLLFAIQRTDFETHGSGFRSVLSMQIYPERTSVPFSRYIWPTVSTVVNSNICSRYSVDKLLGSTAFWQWHIIDMAVLTLGIVRCLDKRYVATTFRRVPLFSSFIFNEIHGGIKGFMTTQF